MSYAHILKGNTHHAPPGSPEGGQFVSADYDSELPGAKIDVPATLTPDVAAMVEAMGSNSILPPEMQPQQAERPPGAMSGEDVHQLMSVFGNALYNKNRVLPGVQGARPMSPDVAEAVRLAQGTMVAIGKVHPDDPFNYSAKDVLHDYTAGGSTGMNIVAGNMDRGAPVAQSNRDNVDTMDKLFDVVPATEREMMVFRATSGRRVGVLEELSYAGEDKFEATVKAAVGTVYKEERYVSTTFSPAMATNWKMGALILDVKVPKGARPVVPGALSDHPSEVEAILPHGSHFRITGGYWDKDRHRHVQVEWLTASKAQKFNPYHDGQGRFAAGDGDSVSFISIGGKFQGQNDRDREKYKAIMAAQNVEFKPLENSKKITAALDYFRSEEDGFVTVQSDWAPDQKFFFEEANKAHEVIRDLPATGTYSDDSVMRHEMRDAIGAYTGGEYTEINATANDLFSGKGQKWEYADTVRALDNVFDRLPPVERNFSVFRSLSGRRSEFEALNKIEDNEEWKTAASKLIGSVYQNTGFSSTSVSPFKAGAFGTGGEGAYSELFTKINLPKGSKALFPGFNAEHPSEGEVILDRGAIFNIKKVWIMDAAMADQYGMSEAHVGNRMVEMEYLGSQKKKNGPVRKELQLIAATSLIGILKNNPNHDQLGRFSSGEGGGGLEFVSPSVNEGMKLPQAEQELKGERHQQVLGAFKEVDQILGLKVNYADVVGAWADGAENSIMTRVMGNPTYDQLRLSAAMKGMLADQKAVIPFKVEKGGPDTMYKVTIPHTDFSKAHDELSKLGLEFHTLKARAGKDGTDPHIEAFVYDQGTKLKDVAIKASEHYDTQITQWRGKGEFLGSWDSREDGRQAYQAVIGAHLGSDRAGQWDGLYHRWRDKHPVVKHLTAILKGDKDGHEFHGNQYSSVDTASEGFKGWFGDSKVVDTSGDPLRVYHGTSADFEGFDPKKSRGRIWVTADPSYASAYGGAENAQDGVGGRVLPLYAAMKNPRTFAIEKNGFSDWVNGPEDTKFKKDGHDGVVFLDHGVFKTGYAFEAGQIKSAVSNTGKFDPKLSDVLKFNSHHGEDGRFVSGYDPHVGRFHNIDPSDEHGKTHPRFNHDGSGYPTKAAERWAQMGVGVEWTNAAIEQFKKDNAKRSIRKWLSKILKFNQNHDEKGRFATGGVSNAEFSDIDRKIIDYNPNKPLGKEKPGDLKRIEDMIPGAQYVPYSKVPFFDELMGKQGIKDIGTTTAWEHKLSRDALFSRQPLEEVPIDHLVFTQNVVNVPAVAKSRDNPHPNPAQVVQYQGKFYLLDGHHRTVADIEDGGKSLHAYVLNLDKLGLYHNRALKTLTRILKGNPNHDEKGRFSSGDLPAAPGTTPIPEGYVRLYHQTSEESLDSIAKEGITFEHAKGTEGPRAIYAGETGFYGKPGQVPTVEFALPKGRWESPFVVGGDVTPKDIIALHYPWHIQARYLLDNPDTLKQALAGEFDTLGGDYAKAVAYVKAHHAAKSLTRILKFNEYHDEKGKFTSVDDGKDFHNVSTIRDVQEADTKALPEDLMGELQSDAKGVIVGAPSVVDGIVSRGGERYQQLYDGFHNTREAIRAKYGDTVTLFRAPPAASEASELVKDKPTVNMGNEKLARRFAENGRTVQRYQVKVDDIIAAPRYPKGYWEIIVRNPDLAKKAGGFTTLVFKYNEHHGADGRFASSDGESEGAAKPTLHHDQIDDLIAQLGTGYNKTKPYAIKDSVAGSEHNDEATKKAEQEAKDAGIRLGGPFISMLDPAPESVKYRSAGEPLYLNNQQWGSVVQAVASQLTYLKSKGAEFTGDTSFRLRDQGVHDGASVGVTYMASSGVPKEMFIDPTAMLTEEEAERSQEEFKKQGVWYSTITSKEMAHGTDSPEALQSAVLHELGHVLTKEQHLQELFKHEDMKPDMVRKNVSIYGAGAPMEAVAEIFAKVMDPDYKRGTLPKSYEHLVDMMIKDSKSKKRKSLTQMLLNGLLPTCQADYDYQPPAEWDRGPQPKLTSQPLQSIAVKFNEHHGADGRFASSDGAADSSLSNDVHIPPEHLKFLEELLRGGDTADVAYVPPYPPRPVKHIDPIKSKDPEIQRAQETMRALNVKVGGQFIAATDMGADTVEYRRSGTPIYLTEKQWKEVSTAAADEFSYLQSKGVDFSKVDLTLRDSGVHLQSAEGVTFNSWDGKQPIEMFIDPTTKMTPFEINRAAERYKESGFRFGVASEIAETKGIGNDYWRAIVRHETGHVLTTKPMMDWLQQQKEMAPPEIRSHVSIYGSSQPREAVAEIFAAVMKPGYVKGSLPKKYEDLVRWMVENKAPRHKFAGMLSHSRIPTEADYAYVPPAEWSADLDDSRLTEKPLQSIAVKGDKDGHEFHGNQYTTSTLSTADLETHRVGLMRQIEAAQTLSAKLRYSPKAVAEQRRNKQSLQTVIDELRQRRSSIKSLTGILKFNPFHDEHGRFTESGNAQSASDNMNERAKMKEKILREVGPEVRAKLDAIEAEIAKGVATTKDPALVDANGNWKPERVALHNQIIQDTLDKMKGYISDHPTMIMLGGRGGSGKSRFTDGTINEFDPKKYYHMDPDKIKQQLPGYNGHNAALFHEEASHIEDQLLALAAANKVNLIHDVTMRSVKSGTEALDLFKQHGYNLEGHYMELPRHIAAIRAVHRAVDAGEEGRYVPIDVVLNHFGNEATFNQLKKYFSRWSMYDNNVPRGQKPKPVSHSKN